MSPSIEIFANAFKRMARRKRIATHQQACPHCNTTAQAMRHVQALWIAAGIDR